MSQLGRTGLGQQLLRAYPTGPLPAPFTCQLRLEPYPTSLCAHYQLALTYEEWGQREQAVKVLTQTVALSPSNSLEVELKAEAQRRLQDLSS